jgi:hypothetical protein
VISHFTITRPFVDALVPFARAEAPLAFGRREAGPVQGVKRDGNLGGTPEAMPFQGICCDATNLRDTTSGHGKILDAFRVLRCILKVR